MSCGTEDTVLSVVFCWAASAKNLTPIFVIHSAFLDLTCAIGQQLTETFKHPCIYSQNLVRGDFFSPGI